MKQIVIGMALAVMAGACCAQEVSLQGYTLEVTQAELNVISEGLAEVPYKRAAPLVQKLNEQILRQIEAAKKARDEQNKPEQKQ